MKQFATYLHYGFLPAPELAADEGLLLWGNPRQMKRKAAEGPVSLVDEGVRVLKQAFSDEIVRSSAGKLNIVPLSGGLDSRSILAALMENVPREQVLAVTFGTPGALDYDIGRLVAKATGVRAEHLDLSSSAWRWDADELLVVAKDVTSPTRIFEAYVNGAIPLRFGAESVYWSGFMGDPLAGSHLAPVPSSNWETAIDRFVPHNRFSCSVSLTPPGFDPKQPLPQAPFLHHEQLSYDEQMDFAIRQRCLIRNLVAPLRVNYRMPFLHPDWVDFILNVSRDFRQRQVLYRSILARAYPEWFSLPTKTSFGASLMSPSWKVAMYRTEGWLWRQLRRRMPWLPWAIDPFINYVDFDQALRKREDLKAAVGDNIQDLKARGIVDWLDMDTMWADHQNGKANHASALIALASAELFLKAGKLAA
jgi:hypothetical protein